jgi:uncharacterized protein (DUF2384 family)
MKVKDRAMINQNIYLLPKESDFMYRDDQTAAEDFPAPGRMYARTIEELHDSGLSAGDVARVVGVAERQVRNWISGADTPSSHNRDRLLKLHYIAHQLRDIYTREGAEIWLHGRKHSLDGRRPIDLLAEGAYDEVLDAVERLHAEGNGMIPDGERLDGEFSLPDTTCVTGYITMTPELYTAWKEFDFSRLWPSTRKAKVRKAKKTKAKAKAKARKAKAKAKGDTK